MSKAAILFVLLLVCQSVWAMPTDWQSSGMLWSDYWQGFSRPVYAPTYQFYLSFGWTGKFSPDQSQFTYYQRWKGELGYVGNVYDKTSQSTISSWIFGGDKTCTANWIDANNLLLSGDRFVGEGRTWGLFTFNIPSQTTEAIEEIPIDQGSLYGSERSGATWRSDGIWYATPSQSASDTTGGIWRRDTAGNYQKLVNQADRPISIVAFRGETLYYASSWTDESTRRFMHELWAYEPAIGVISLAHSGFGAYPVLSPDGSQIAVLDYAIETGEHWSIQPVPEPSSLMALGALLAPMGIGIIRRKPRR